MTKKLVVGFAVFMSAIFCLGVIFPAQAAPTLRQQVTFADGMVQVAEAMNNGCTAVADAYQAQIDGVTSTNSDSAFDGYFGCLMSASAGFVAEHWAPAPALKTVRASVIKLADGLGGSIKYMDAQASSTDFALFLANVENNKLLIATVKKKYFGGEEKISVERQDRQRFFEKNSR